MFYTVLELALHLIT